MFGVPVENLDFVHLPGYSADIPAVLYGLKHKIIDLGGLSREGIFRITGSEAEYQTAMNALDTGSALADLDVSSDVLSQMMKAFFRLYPIPTPGFFPQEMLEAESTDDILLAFDKLDEPWRSVLLFTMDFCIEISDAEEVNRMSLEALSIVFSPNFVRHSDSMTLLKLQRSAQNAFLKLCELRKQNVIVNDLLPNPWQMTRYMPSYNTGVFGSYVWPPRKDIRLRRSITLHSKEIVYQLNANMEPQFKLSFRAFDEKESLTPTEEHQVDELRAILADKHEYTDVSRDELIRYVLGCKHRMNYAEERFLKMKAIEREYNLNDVRLDQVRDELHKPYFSLGGRDVNGHGMIVFRANQINPREMDFPVFIKAIITMCDAVVSDLDVLREGVVVVIDMAGFKGTQNYSKEFAAAFIDVFREAYPMRLKNFILVNPPILLRVVLKIVKPFLSNKIKDRFVVAMGDALFDYAHQSQVPSCVGGTFDLDNDGTNPRDAWEFLVSRVSYMPPMELVDRKHTHDVGNIPNAEDDLKEDPADDLLEDIDGDNVTTTPGDVPPQEPAVEM